MSFVNFAATAPAPSRDIGVRNNVADEMSAQ